MISWPLRHAITSTISIPYKKLKQKKKNQNYLFLQITVLLLPSIQILFISLRLRLRTVSSSDLTIYTFYIFFSDLISLNPCQCYAVWSDWFIKRSEMKFSLSFSASEQRVTELFYGCLQICLFSFV